MLKKIELKLSQIKYKGESIGDDIRLEIQVLDKFLYLDKRIKAGETKEFNEEIGAFICERNYFEAKANITIVEKDIIFNDTANIAGTVKVDANNAGPQKFVYEIELRESRFHKNWGKSAAVFEVTIEAQVGEAIQYIPDVNNGWLLVRILNGEAISLPAFLKVKSLYYKNNREYFEILEGHYKGKTASVKLKGEKSYLLPSVKHEPPVHLKYSISKRKLIIGKDKYSAADDEDTPWEKGFYDIEMPDYPHPKGNEYEEKAERAKTWFRIGHKGTRYLHTGKFSSGCITITDIKKWDEIYDKLIKARKGDFISLGVIEIID
jgi:hypothetical protein